MDLRLFAALDPSGPVREQIADRQAVVRRAAGHLADLVRWTPVDRLHVTLQFLGAVPEERVPSIRAAMEAAAAASRPLALEVIGAGGFPGPGRPRVVWLGVRDDEGRLVALAADLADRLAALGFPRTGRPLSPHFTLGRARDGRGPPGLGGAIAAAAVAPGIRWPATELCLFRSHLSSAGARYEALARFPLGPIRDGAGEK